MKIVLCCAGGLSTTMLMDSMKAIVKKSAKLNEDDFSFVAIPVPYHIPYVIVDQEVYGKMDGATVMKQVLIARRKADMAK